VSKEPLLNPSQFAVVRAAVETLKASGKTQKQIADKVHLSQQTISKILKGEVVGIHAAKKIGEATRAFDVAALLGGAAESQARNGALAARSDELSAAHQVALDEAAAMLVLQHKWPKPRAEAAVNASPPHFEHSGAELTAEHIVKFVLATDALLKKFTGRRPVKPKKPE
jgi:transcriptional regulator with XRE-family HTH domain